MKKSKKVMGRIDEIILIEAPRRIDAEFYGRWLLAAAEAERLWKEALADLSFHEEIEGLTSWFLPNFGGAAVELITQLDQRMATCVVELGTELGHEFTMLLVVGFFVLTGERYQMCVPPLLTLANVKAASKTYAETEDQDGMLHPEHLVTTMPHSEAEAWRRRLAAMDFGHREADRRLLLE